MDNLLLARLALIPLASVEIAYVYFYVRYLYSALPKYSVGWCAYWILLILIVGGTTFGQIYIYKSFTGRNRVADDTFLALMIVFGHMVSIGIGFYILWKRRSG